MTKVALLINEVQLSPNIPQSSSKIQPECLVPAHTAQASLTLDKRGVKFRESFHSIRRWPLIPIIDKYHYGQLREYCENSREISLTALGRTGRAPVVRLMLRDSCKLTV